MSRKVLCLDWDARALRMVVATVRRGQMTLEDAHSHRVPSNVDVETPASMGPFIQQMIKRHRWGHRRVVVDIPRERSVINRLTLPPTPDHELAAAVRFQAMKELPFPLDTAVVDYVVMSRNEAGLATEVLLAAVTQDTLAAVQATCEAAGLVPERVGLRPHSNLVSLRHVEQAQARRVLLVDVGPNMSEIDVVEGEQLVFARSANVALPLPPEPSVEDSSVTPMADVSDLALADDAVETAVRELVVEITRTLQAFRVSEPDAQIDHIVVAGGTGIETQLMDAVSQRFGLEANLFEPTAALGVPASDGEKLRSFSAALGMAWGMSREGLLELDFLNPKKPIPPGHALKQRLRLGGIAAAVLLTAGVSAYVWFYQQQVAELTVYEKQLSVVKQELEQYLKVENQLEEVRDWQYDAIWPEHLLLLTKHAVSPGEEMIVQQASFDARTASINLKKVLAKHWTVPTDFVGQLNEIEDDGEQVYLARQGSWRTLKTRGSDFSGTVDIDIELRDLKQHLEERDERVKARKRKLRF